MLRALLVGDGTAKGVADNMTGCELAGAKYPSDNIASAAQAARRTRDVGLEGFN
ncbi:MAG: hypothetical protein ABL985_18505 [Casimicrobium sp.]